MTLKVDVNGLTLDQLDQAERAITEPMDEWTRSRYIGVAVWFALRETDPDATLTEAMAIPLTQLEIVGELPDPTGRPGGTGS